MLSDNIPSSLLSIMVKMVALVEPGTAFAEGRKLLKKILNCWSSPSNWPSRVMLIPTHCTSPFTVLCAGKVSSTALRE